MIRESFVILDNIKHKKEKSLWDQGINSWNDFLEKEEVKGLSKIKKLYYDSQIQKATTMGRSR